MANKSQSTRKRYGLLSVVLCIGLLCSMLIMPVTVSAADDLPTMIVVQDTFDTLNGWEYTDGIATVSGGELELQTGANEVNGTDGYTANVITRPEVTTEQSVTVEVPCSELAAGKYPAIWLRVQDDGSTKKGYALLWSDVSSSQISLGLWRLETTSATSRAFVTEHRKIAKSYFSSTAAGDTMKITFSATGTTPTLLTMSSEFVNNGWAVETQREDSTALYQTSGKVALSAVSSDATNVIGIDNFVYKSDTVDAYVTDDFSPVTNIPLRSDWVTYPSAENFTIVDEQLRFVIDTNNVSTGSAYRLQRPVEENALNQTVSISVSGEQLDAKSWPVLWLRSAERENGLLSGYYMTWTGSQISLSYVLSDGTVVSGSKTNLSKVASYDKFVYTFSVADDGETTTLSGSINCIDTTGATSSWLKNCTPASVTVPALQRAGAVAVSGIEYGGTSEKSSLTIDDFVYTAGSLTVTDDFGAGLGAGWTGYPDSSYFSRANGKMSILATKTDYYKHKLQRPMGESAVEQFASITTTASSFPSMGWTHLWLRVQNTNADAAPVGYFCYFIANSMRIAKITSDGTETELGRRTCTISDYSIYDSITYNFTATSNGDGSTTLLFRLIGNKNNGAANLVMDYTVTDSTAELQNAGTVAVTARNNKTGANTQTVYIDDFRYTYPKITGEAESTINLLDLIRLKKYLVGAKGTIGAYADYDEDGLIGSSDLVKCRKYLLGIELIGGEFVASEEIIGGASAAAETLKAGILGLADTVSATRTTYYVSNSGNDSNAGTSAGAPFKTVEKINTLSLKSGDAVLFKRGDVFRTTETIDMVSGVSYGAYGEGDKPVISGSLKDYADASLWTGSDGNIWQASVAGNEIGNIVFDNGKAFGQFKTRLSAVRHNGDYYFDAANHTVYLFFRKNNPGEYFNSIEIATTETIFSTAVEARTNVTIENIAIKNAAQFGVSTLYNAVNFAIRGCEFGFIGGGYSEDNSAYLGNAIEFWNNASGCVVENNYIYQIYDAAVTFQGPGSAGGFTGLTYRNNLIENCSMNFEFWIRNATTDNTSAVISDITFANNILRFGGNGFGSKVRPTKESFGFLLARDTEYLEGQVTNFNVTGNIFDCTKDSFIYATNIMNMMNINGNSYYQTAGSSSQVVRGTGLYATNANQLYTAVTSVDANPVAVVWVD